MLPVQHGVPDTWQGIVGPSLQAMFGRGRSTPEERCPDRPLDGNRSKQKPIRGRHNNQPIVRSGLVASIRPENLPVNKQNDGSFRCALVIWSVQIEFQRKDGVLVAVPALMAQAVSVDDVFFYQYFPLGICVHRGRGRDGWSRSGPGRRCMPVGPVRAK